MSVFHSTDLSAFLYNQDKDSLTCRHSSMAFDLDLQAGKAEMELRQGAGYML